MHFVDDLDDDLTQAYYKGRLAYGTRQRCPYARQDWAKEWKRGREEAKRADKDLRPNWRRGRK